MASFSSWWCGVLAFFLVLFTFESYVVVAAMMVPLVLGYENPTKLVEAVPKLSRDVAWCVAGLVILILAVYTVVKFKPVLSPLKRIVFNVLQFVLGSERKQAVLKLLLGFLLHGLWFEASKAATGPILNLNLPLVIFICFSTSMVIQVKLSVMIDEVGILEEIAACFLRFALEFNERADYVNASLCLVPTLVAIAAVISPPADLEEGLETWGSHISGKPTIPVYKVPE